MRGNKGNGGNFIKKRNVVSFPDDFDERKDVMYNCIRKNKHGNERLDFNKFYEMLLKEKGIILE